MSIGKKKKLEASLDGLFSKSKPKPEEVVSGDVVEDSRVDDKQIHFSQQHSSQNQFQDTSLTNISDEGLTSAVAKNNGGVAYVQPLQRDLDQASTIDTNPPGNHGDISFEHTQVLIFEIEKNLYAISVSSVTTIIKPQTVYEVPNTPSTINGLINLRGQIVPVVNLRVSLGIDPKPVDRNTRFVVVTHKDVIASLVVDAVIGVETFSPKQLEEPNHLITNINTRYLKAVSHHNNQLVLILDLEQTLRLR